MAFNNPEVAAVRALTDFSSSSPDRSVELRAARRCTALNSSVRLVELEIEGGKWGGRGGEEGEEGEEGNRAPAQQDESLWFCCS